MTTRIDEDREADREEFLIEIENELKEYGSYSGLNGVELTFQDWVQIQSESKDLTDALQAACDTIDQLYEQAK